jgi:hypothetical protein
MARSNELKIRVSGRMAVRSRELQVAKPVTQFSARADYLFGGGCGAGRDGCAAAARWRETMDRLAESQRQTIGTGRPAET